jgi:hypothetical protein
MTVFLGVYDMPKCLGTVNPANEKYIFAIGPASTDTA